MLHDLDEFIEQVPQPDEEAVETRIYRGLDRHKKDIWEIIWKTPYGISGPSKEEAEKRHREYVGKMEEEHGLKPGDYYYDVPAVDYHYGTLIRR